MRASGTLHWDILRLYADVLEGLRAGQAETSGAGGLASVGIDSWGVDYGLLDRTGALLGNPVHYRDARTDGAADLLGARIAADGRYAATGIQELPFNTIYQPHRGGGHAAAGRGGHAAADTRPARLLAHRADGGGIHQRLDDAAARRPDRGLGVAADRRGGSPGISSLPYAHPAA